MDTTAVIVGAGQAGLAMSSCLTRRGIDHVVLERGRIGERWQSERWDSLQLLTPNWMTRLPGYRYDGPDPDGFMTMPEVAAFFRAYAESFSAPVIGDTTVFGTTRTSGRFELQTSSGTFRSRFLIAATGASATPNIPASASDAPARLGQTTPKFYRRPEQLSDGGVLVVGASASGIQLAREIHESGRPVIIAVGGHTRLPRRYRGVDIHQWFDWMGTLDRTHDTFADLDAARAEPSLQLVGTAEGRNVDLVELDRIGVRIAGRLQGFDGERATFDRSLRRSIAAADDGQAGLLARIDRWATEHGLDAELDGPHRPPSLPVGGDITDLDLRVAGISSVMWATGYRPDYSWMGLPVVRPDGGIDHDGGIVTSCPGLYLMGMPLMRTRKSTYIDGVAADAEYLSGHLSGRLGLDDLVTSGTVTG